MKKIFKVLAVTALAGMVLTVTASAGAADEKPKFNFEAFEEEDPYNMAAPAILAKMTAMEYTGTTGTLKYRIYESPAYKNKSADTPAIMLVFLHGSGGKGSDNEGQIKDQQTTVNYLVCDLGEEMFKDIPYVVIAPQCPEGAQWVETDYAGSSYSIDALPISAPLRLVYELVCDMQNEKGINPQNTIVGGISMGGYGAWDLGLRHPEICDSLIPICGAGDPSKAEAIKDKRIWAFHSDNDASVPVEGSREMIDALKAGGAKKVSYTEFQGKGHNAWGPAMTEVKDPYLLEWIFETPKFATYTITTELEGEGTVSETMSSVAAGETVKVEFSPKDGYAPKGVYLDGAEITPVVPQDGAMYVEIKNVNADHTVKVVFEKLEELSAEDSAGDAKPQKKGGLSKGAKIALAVGGAIAVAAGVAVAIGSSKKKKK